MVGPGVSSIEQDRDRYFAASRVRREVLLTLLEGVLPVLAGLLGLVGPGRLGDGLGAEQFGLSFGPDRVGE